MTLQGTVTSIALNFDGSTKVNIDLGGEGRASCEEGGGYLVMSFQPGTPCWLGEKVVVTLRTGNDQPL